LLTYAHCMLAIGYCMRSARKQFLSSARIYRPSFHENKPKTIVFSNRK
jgi:hypothetical protein